jgi:iron complex transport system permease protein
MKPLNSRLISLKRCSLLLLIALPLVSLLGLMTGPVFISLSDILAIIFFGGGDGANSQEKLIVEIIRLPRVVLSLLVGALLATCGALLQGLFRNPLADPALIGVSAGASVGASLVIVFGSMLTANGVLLGLSAISVGAFAGAIITSVIIFRLATGPQGTSVATMLLAGIAISALAGAATNTLSYLADNDMLRRISLWQMGNLQGASWDRVGLCAVTAGFLGLLIPREAGALNAMLLGESEARHLGVNVEWLKRRLIIYSALGVAISVAVAGVIAFVGLMVPHLIRLLVGPNHRVLLPLSALAGAILLVAADALARVVIAPAELPVGVVTALLGAPFFLWLLVVQRRRA